jgi:hypothetical protein
LITRLALAVLGDGGLRRHSSVRARVADRLAAAAAGAPARLRAALASVEEKLEIGSAHWTISATG